LRQSEGQRIARTINGRMLRVLKAFATPVANIPKIDGLKLQYSIAHKNFIEDMEAPQVDKLEFYAAREFIRSFAEADMTSQQLADTSVIILNGNRISVQLSQ
jgi:hypothetical protein